MKNGGTALLMSVAIVVAVLIGVRSWANRRERRAVPATTASPMTAPAVNEPPGRQGRQDAPAEVLRPVPRPLSPMAPLPWPAACAPAAPLTPAAPVLPAPAVPSPTTAPTPWMASERIADTLEAALQADLRPFQEAHWNGLEVVPATAALLRSLGLPTDARGVIVDDVTMPADLEGFQAGDLVTSIQRVPTPDLPRFLAAADRVGDRRRAEVELVREGRPQTLVITARERRLGTANGETAPMIRPGSRPPHDYLGPCTDCHRIGTTGQLARDPGDALAATAPTIRAGHAAPHRDRGECTTCHTIVP